MGIRWVQCKADRYGDRPVVEDDVLSLGNHLFRVMRKHVNLDDLKFLNLESSS